MSLIKKKNIQLKAVSPQVINYTNKELFTLERGIIQKTMNRLVANTVNNNNIVFNVLTNSKDSRLGRNWVIELDFTATISASGSVYADYFQTGYAALRNLPLSQCISNCQVQLGSNGNFNTETYNLVSPLSRMNWSNEDMNSFITGMPNQPDFFQTYADGRNSSMNVNSTVFNSVLNNPLGRGAWLPSSISDGATATLTYKIYEPLISPILRGRCDEDGVALTYLNNAKVNLQLTGLERMFALDSGANGAFSSISVSISNATLHYEEYSTSIFEQIPKEICYSYEEFSPVNNTNVGSKSAGASFSATSQAYQLSCVPKLALIYLDRQRADKTYLTSDAFARINSISINYNNQAGLLSGKDSFDLFKVSVANGLSMSWPQWSNFTGSVLALSFATDLSISPDLAPAVPNKCNFQCTVNATNLASESINFDLNVVFIFDGCLTIDTSSQIQQIELFTKEDVLAASQLEQIPRPVGRYLGGGLVGGSWWDSFKKGWNLVMDPIKKSKIISTTLGAIPETKMLVPIATSLGYGAKIGGKKMKRRDF